MAPTMSQFFPKLRAIIVIEFRDALELIRLLCNESSFAEKWFNFLQLVLGGISGYISQQTISWNSYDCMSSVCVPQEDMSDEAHEDCELYN